MTNLSPTGKAGTVTHFPLTVVSTVVALTMTYDSLEGITEGFCARHEKRACKLAACLVRRIVQQADEKAAQRSGYSKNYFRLVANCKSLDICSFLLNRTRSSGTSISTPVTIAQPKPTNRKIPPSRNGGRDI